MKLRYKITIGILAFLALSITALAITLGHNSACTPSPQVSGELMRAIVYRCYGGPDVLHLEDVEKPMPTANQVLVKVHSAAINPLDWHYMRGTPYIMRMESGIGAPADTSLGVDFAGTVEAVGRDVTRFKAGDEVFGGRSGAFGEYVIISDNRAIVLKPDNVSFAEAAGVSIAAVTALQALRDKGQIKPGHKVLINGASGGVGTYAVQIAKALGAEVTGVCSTRNVELVRSLGADHVIDYKNENYTENGEKYDIILDNVSNHSLSANRGVMTDDGVYIIVGGGGGNWLGFLSGPLSAVLSAPFVSQKQELILATLRQDDLQIIADMMRADQVTTVIDRHFALAEVAEAIEYSETGRARGKIIIDVE